MHFSFIEVAINDPLVAFPAQPPDVSNAHIFTRDPPHYSDKLVNLLRQRENLRCAPFPSGTHHESAAFALFPPDALIFLYVAHASRMHHSGVPSTSAISVGHTSLPSSVTNLTILPSSSSPSSVEALPTMISLLLARVMATLTRRQSDKRSPTLRAALFRTREIRMTSLSRP